MNTKLLSENKYDKLRLKYELQSVRLNTRKNGSSSRLRGSDVLHHR
jgi:hypothetical protein